jgi:phage-related protein
MGKDGGYTFEDGFNNIKLPITFRLVKNNAILRRRQISEIANWLRGSGNLVIGLESDVYYEARSSGINSSVVFYQDSFVVTFDCKPVKKSTYDNDDITWDMAEMLWELAEVPLDGLDVGFTDVDSGDVLTISNLGTYRALPIIVLSGTATTLTIVDDAGHSFTYSGLNGTIYIDCEELMVYSESGGVKTNKMSYFSGSFIELIPGENSINVSGTGFVSLNISFDYRNSYL